jgi:four helix bundle protein
MAVIEGYKDLHVYNKAFLLAMKIFEISKGFPKEERYSLTDQIRRSSRSVTANIAEAWGKRIYIKSFISKLSDSFAEEQETEVWIRYSKSCNYIDNMAYTELMSLSGEVRRMLISMIDEPEKFIKNNKYVNGK